MLRNALSLMRSRHAFALLLLAVPLATPACSTYGGRSTPRALTYPTTTPPHATGAAPATATVPAPAPAPAPQPAPPQEPHAP